MTRLTVLILFAVLLAREAAAQSDDAAYCKKLGDYASRYLGDPGGNGPDDPRPQGPGDFTNPEPGPDCNPILASCDLTAPPLSLARPSPLPPVSAACFAVGLVNLDTPSGYAGATPPVLLPPPAAS